MKRILLLLAIVSNISVNAQVITTIAGNGTASAAGADGVPATSEGIEPDWQLTIDKIGNIYFSEGVRIRKIDTAGIITTIAGTGVSGPTIDGIPATAAQLSATAGLAVDNNLNIYFSQKTLLHKIDAGGMLSLYAGSPGPGTPGDGDEGPATAAHFQSVGHLFYALGNLYLYDALEIRRIDGAGIIHQVAGKLGFLAPPLGDGGPATAARLTGFSFMAIDSKGDLYLAGSNTLRMVDPSGIMHGIIYGATYAEGGDGGPATAASYNDIQGICIDTKDNIYLGCEYGGRIRRIDAATGIVTTFAGTTEGYGGDGGPATAAQLYESLRFLAADCGDNIYVADGSNYRIRKITQLHTPWYTAESNKITVCQNSTANSCGSLLGAASQGTGEAIDWSMSMAPKHGTLGGVPYTTTVTTGTITPTPITYTPAAGYLGTDSFTIDLDCSQVGRSRTIYVTVEVPPTVAAITGTATAVCKGKTITLASATAGGVWSAASTAVSVSAGVVTGVATGTTTVSYTVADGGCSNSATYAVEVKECGLASPQPSPKEREVLRIYPNPVGDLLHVDVLAGSYTYRLHDMMGREALHGALDNNAGNVINVQHVASGVYVLEVTDVQTGLRDTRRVVIEPLRP